MAEGAYIGAQGVTPDLRPSVQAAVENDRARRAERKEEQRYQQQLDLEYKKLDAEREMHKATLQQNYIKQRAETLQKWGTDFGKQCMEAQGDLSKNSAFLEFCNPTIERIAQLREMAENGDFEFSAKHKQEAENLLNTLKMFASVAHDYSELFPSDYLENMNEFKQDTINNLSAEKYYETFTNKNWEYKTGKDSSRYITNGAVVIGSDAKGNPLLAVGDKTFSNPQALRDYLGSSMIQKDDALVNELESVYKLTPNKNSETLADGSTSTTYDIEDYNTRVMTAINNSSLGTYEDSYTYEDARRDGDGRLITLFQDAGMQNGAFTVEELKRDIAEDARISQNVSTVNKDAPSKDKGIATIVAMDYSDASVRNNVKTLSRNATQSEKNKANVLDRTFSIVDAFNKVVNNADGTDITDAFAAWGLKASANQDGTITLSSPMQYSTTENEKGETTRYSGKDGITFNPNDPQSVRSAFEMIVNADNKAHSGEPTISMSEIAPVVNFEGYNTKGSAPQSEARNNLDVLMRYYDENSTSNSKKITIGDTSNEKANTIIHDYLQEYIRGIDENAIVKLNPASMGNDVGITITVNGKTKTYTLNTNIDEDEKTEDKWKDMTVRAVIEKIISDFPVTRTTYSGSLYRKNSTPTRPASNPGKVGNTAQSTTSSTDTSTGLD